MSGTANPMTQHDIPEGSYLPALLLSL